LEANESLIQASIREALEETGRHFMPSHVLGVYRWTHPSLDITYLRFAFAGTVSEELPGQELDHGILRAMWMTVEDLNRTKAKHRSPLVLRCVEDYLSGKRYPLDILAHYD
jgi:NADH pyrophosphatase NudC (nudix superfamily)